MMDSSRFNPAKPLALSAICVIGLINAVQMFNAALSPVAKQFGAMYPWFFGLSGVLGVACVLGLWWLRRWAAWLYVLVLIANQAVLLSTGLWEASALVVPTVIVFVLLRYLKHLID